MAAPQTGLTSCRIGDMGHPGTVHGNPRHIPASLIMSAQHMNPYLLLYVSDVLRSTLIAL